MDKSYTTNEDGTDCYDGGWTFAISSYVIDKCTYRQSDDVSAFVTCEKDAIYYTRYFNSNNCTEIINSTNNATNVRRNNMTLGCQFRVNPPHTPNGYISSIDCATAINTIEPTSPPTTSLPTPSPSIKCSYTVIPEADDGLARGVAVPLDTCLPAPFDGVSYSYTCNKNKTGVIKQTYTSSIKCDLSESVIINTTYDSV